ncbi:hypothetical protein B0H13DRAFT_2322723 [Mycena leptocephala]|nr:hypothetical protein B0H13DRAFT_2322723 [Mycena leptocephala]
MPTHHLPRAHTPRLALLPSSTLLKPSFETDDDDTDAICLRTGTEIRTNHVALASPYWSWMETDERTRMGMGMDGGREGNGHRHHRNGDGNGRDNTHPTRTENDGARAGDAASRLRVSMEVEAREKRRCGVGVYPHARTRADRGGGGIADARSRVLMKQGAGEVELEVEAEREVETEMEMISMRMLVSMELEKCMGAGVTAALSLTSPSRLPSLAPPPRSPSHLLPSVPALLVTAAPPPLPCYESRRDLPAAFVSLYVRTSMLMGMEVEEEEVERTDEMEMGTAQPGTGKTAAFILDNAQSCPIEKATSRKIMRIETNDVAEMEEKMKEALK